jgi:hypothetical protein
MKYRPRKRLRGFCFGNKKVPKTFMQKESVLNHSNCKRNRMMRSLRHTRFTKRNVLQSLPECYWYVQANSSVEPIGMWNDKPYQRLEFVHT